MLALSLAGAASASAAGSFDGQWSVQLTTQHGDCDPSYSWSVAVTDGRISDAGMFMQAAGAIDRRGRVQIRIIHGSDVVAASGRVSGEFARGAWLSPTRQCSGAWSAQRS
jgi:hypothetical protein